MEVQKQLQQASFESGIKYNIYYKLLLLDLVIIHMIDDPEFGTVGQDNTNAIMLTITGDGITSTFDINEDLLVTKDGDTIIIRKELSDGAFTPGVIFDTEISGGLSTNW